MKTVIGVFAAAAVAMTGAPALADPHSGHVMTQQMKHQQKHARKAARHAAKDQARLFRMGQRVPRSYAWTPYGQLPQTYVSQYSLSPDYRYVYRDNYIYVVDPRTYAVTRVLEALPH